MLETRVVNKIEKVDDGDNIVKVTWDVLRDDQYSHSNEQCYVKSNFLQFFSDVGNAAVPFAEFFDIKF